MKYVRTVGVQVGFELYTSRIRARSVADEANTLSSRYHVRQMCKCSSSARFESFCTVYDGMKWFNIIQDGSVQLSSSQQREKLYAVTHFYIHSF